MTPRKKKAAEEQPVQVVAADESMAAEEVAIEAPGWIEQVVVFHLAGQRYALDIETVQEIQQIVALSEVPAGVGGVIGMVNLRGNVIPALDMRRLVGLETLEYSLETPMIICRTRGQLIALVVDEVEDVLELPDGCMQAATPLHALSEKMVGVCRLDDGLIYVLDLDRLVGHTSRGGM